MSFGWNVGSAEELQRLLVEAGSDAQVFDPQAGIAPAPAIQAMTEATVTEAPATRRRATAKPIRTEHEEQVLLFQRAEQMDDEYPELSLMFAIPNGAKLPYTKDRNGKRYSKQGAILKAEGLRAGVPDIFLPIPRHGVGRRITWHGLFIEMKVGRGKLTDLQREWMSHLRAQGYACVLAYGAEQALDAIIAYLHGRLDLKREEG